MAVAMAAPAAFACLLLLFPRSLEATMLTDAIATGKPLSMKRCLAQTPQELNLKVLPKECHEDIQQFYCQRVRDVASKRYSERLRGDCQQSAESQDPQMKPQAYAPAKIGYVIMGHRFPQNVKRLVSRLFEPGSTAFAIHVDEKSPSMYDDLRHWREVERLESVVQVFSEFNVVRGGPNMLKAELQGIRLLLNATVRWDFCILLSEQDYPLRANSVLAEYLWVHRGTSFVSVDEGECERDVSYQCGDRVVSLSGGAQYPKVPGMRYGSGSQWFVVTWDFAEAVANDTGKPSTVVGAIFRDLTTVKQPDESFFQAVVLNTRFCALYSDYTLVWTDKDSMREVRSDTSEYNILSPGVLSSLTDYFKLEEVRKQSLWAFFAR
ncbi:unnamed protein product, partial [Polarella glacialis]